MTFSIQNKLIAYALFVSLIIGGGASVYAVYNERDQIIHEHQATAWATLSLLAQNLIDPIHNLHIHSITLSVVR
ncbi:MAG: hypothetical protein ACE5FN_10860 [Leptospirillia bacterium]